MKFKKDKDGYTEVSCRVKGDGLLSILKILRHCQYHGGIGHSFSIELDPDSSEYGRTVGWDGDGADSIKDIEVGGEALDQDEIDDEMKLARIAARLTRELILSWNVSCSHPENSSVSR